ncbi:MAG: YkgJ family cysteine cluster protein [Methanosarcinaceae archaeon]|nr:YkgJ family cysteine cluster protein [Methanosarcinaceae archaeon]
MVLDYRLILTQQLELMLKQARDISVEDLASEIQRIGFACTMCGGCCRRSGGDNCVFLTTVDVEYLEGNSQMDQVAIPMLADGINYSSRSYLGCGSDDALSPDVDQEGNIHTFGWMLPRNSNGDCRFLQGSLNTGKCGIYEIRPMLCRTYPFYMDEGQLLISECEGLGCAISWSDSLKMASNVLHRYVEELEDTLLTYKMFDDVELYPGAPASVEQENGMVNVIVHDARGAHRVSMRIE